jgi:nucleotide-binding universal stress UspA family protein
MYKRVLAAVNEYTNSEMAARYAIVLSQSCGARLFLAFVAEKSTDKEAFKHAEAALERLFVHAREHGVDVESVTETGDPFWKIQDLVRKEDIDLAFTGTRRADQKVRFFQRSRARELVIGLRCSVAMVRVVRMARTHPKNILVPLRRQMSSLEERSCFVAELAKGFKAEVTLFHATRPITTFFRGETLLAPAEREKKIPPDVEQFAHCLKRHGVSHERRTSYGRVSRAITIEAAHRKNDLIVMGASERSLLSSMVSGNPVEEVLRETPCNLIIFRPRRRHQ